MLKERIKGALLSLAVGDALGFPFEGQAREKLAHVDLHTYATGKYGRGVWSDDTSLTFCTVLSLLERDGLDPEDLAQKFAAWWTKGFLTPHGKAIGAGRTTVEAIKRYLSGTHPLLCGGQDERSNGNGSLMRILPVALFYASSPVAELLSFLHQASCLTHAHPRSQMACGFYGLFVRALLKGYKRKEAWTGVVQNFPEFYKKYFPDMAPELAHFQRLLDPDFPRLPRHEIKSNAYVVHSLEATSWVFLRAASLEKALEEAVRLGQDTDTTAAIVGGLAGLYWGLQALPAHLLAGLAKRGKLEDLAERFALRLEEQYAG